MSSARDTMAQARAALREITANLVALLRGAPDGHRTSVGTWTVGDVAAHLTHTFRFDIDALAGESVPAATVTTAGMAELNAHLLARDSERDLAVLADRLETLDKEFRDVASHSTATTVDWLQGARLPASAVACHLLEECLVHGHDIARAVGRPWPIRRAHALLAVEGAAFALITALPTAFVNQERGGSFHARFDVRLRAGSRVLMMFDGGSLTVRATDGAADVDAYIRADPTALMLLFIGRQALWKPLLGGQLLAWGPRPWKLARMLAVISPP